MRPLQNRWVAEPPHTPPVQLDQIMHLATSRIAVAALLALFACTALAAQLGPTSIELTPVYEAEGAHPGSTSGRGGQKKPPRPRDGTGRRQGPAGRAWALRGGTLRDRPFPASRNRIKGGLAR